MIDKTVSAQKIKPYPLGLPRSLFQKPHHILPNQIRLQVDRRTR
jgi:hypothetical protein